jgi:hypothetical protein
MKSLVWWEKTLHRGMWRLEIIDVFSAGVMNRYNFGKEFQKEVVVRIENPRHVRFPEIKDVTLQPPK